MQQDEPKEECDAASFARVSAICGASFDRCPSGLGLREEAGGLPGRPGDHGPRRWHVVRRLGHGECLTWRRCSGDSTHGADRDPHRGRGAEGCLFRASPEAGPRAGASPLKDIFFEYDKAVIGADQKAALDDNARWLKTNANARIAIEGHCDERGPAEYNLGLGDRRAKAVRDYLISSGIAGEPDQHDQLWQGAAVRPWPRREGVAAESSSPLRGSGEVSRSALSRRPSATGERGVGALVFPYEVLCPMR